MDNKFKFSEQPRRVKILYASVIGVLCISAVVVGIVSGSAKGGEIQEDEPTINVTPSDEENEKADGGDDNNNQQADSSTEEDNKPEKISFVSPIVGEITKGHSIDMPVFSSTLQEWRVHTGIDIAASEGDDVYAVCDGTVTRVFNDAFLGRTVEITHGGDIVSVYSNLSNEGISVKVGDTVKSGDVIGKVGDTSISELADEPHLHFSVKVGGVGVNPLDYISDESKKASLGISTV